MTPEEVRRSSELLYKLAAEVLEKRLMLQAACPHAAPTYKYRGDTGNWDKSDDKYWIDWACTDCGKQWQTPQDQG